MRQNKIPRDKASQLQDLDPKKDWAARFFGRRRARFDEMWKFQFVWDRGEQFSQIRDRILVLLQQLRFYDNYNYL